MDVKVYDKDGMEQGWQWAVDRYGVRLVEATPPAGATVYRLAELRQKVGPCGMTVKVLDEDGAPLPGVVVLQGWVDGPDLPPDAAPRLSAYVWAQPDGKPNRGSGDFTNADGVMGWGWGPGEQYDPAYQEGAHWYWIMPGDEQAYSDVPLGFGWLFGTDHDTLDITFVRSIGEVEPEPPEPPPVTEPLDLSPVVEELERQTAELARIANALVSIDQKWPLMFPSYTATILPGPPVDPGINITWSPDSTPDSS